MMNTAFINQAPIQYLSGERNLRIAYRHLIHANQEDPTISQSQSAVRKLLILVNGRGENMLKWANIATDFYEQGYDVLMFDHRGQGYSSRIIPNSEKGHLDEFRFYASDMAKIIEKVTALYPYENQYLLAHSLGGLISSYYLAHFDHHIQKAVLSAPFFGVPFKNPIRDELMTAVMVAFGQGERYLFGKGDYRPVNVETTALSHNQAEMTRMNDINQTYPEIHLGGPTFRWLHLCQNAIKKLPRVLPKIETPMLILQAEEESIVDNQSLDKLTALLPQAQKVLIEHAKHEILFEVESVKKKALAAITDYFL